MKKNSEKLFNKEGVVIGVDGGGTKTEAWAIDSSGKILGVGKAGPSNLRNLGIEKSISNIVKSIELSYLKLKKNNVLSVFIGLPAFAEEYRTKEIEIKKEFLKQNKINFISNNNLFIGSDQEIAFKSGTNEKEGIVVISGTGSVVRGWKGKESVKCSGWGWLSDKGSSYWAGKKAFEKTIEAMDGRIQKSILTELVIKKFKVKNIEELNRIVYEMEHIDIFPRLALLVDESSKKKDVIARDILNEVSNELFLATKTVIKKLKFNKKVPIILVGGMFKSKILLDFFEKEIKKNNLNVEIIIPIKPPVYGAVKSAIQKINGKS
jgi:glucosamine kinase